MQTETLLAVIEVSSALTDACPLLKVALIELTTSLPNVKPMFLNAVETKSKDSTRPVLDEEIQRVYSQLLSKKTCFIHCRSRPEEGGNSRVVAHSLVEKRGVIQILISHSNINPSAFLIRLLQQCGRVVEGSAVA